MLFSQVTYVVVFDGEVPDIISRLC